MWIQLPAASKELGTCVHVCWKTVSARPNHKDVPGPWQLRGSSWNEQGAQLQDVRAMWKNWPYSSRATLQQGWQGWSGSTSLHKCFQAFLPCEEYVELSCESAGMHFFRPELSLGSKEKIHLKKRKNTFVKRKIYWAFLWHFLGKGLF